jgi:hypothetical protein
MEATEEEYRLIAARSTDELLEGLGGFIARQEARSLGTRPKPRPKEGYAREWLEQEKQNLQDLICPNEKIQRFLTEGGTPNYRLVQTIVDLVSTAYVGFPCLIIAELIARSGLGKFCKSHASEKASFSFKYE